MENNNENLNSEQKMAEVKAWLAYADMDFNTADHLLNGAFYPLPLEIICYHSQQAAEKAVKAVIVYFGNRGGMPKVHDISFLMNQVHNAVKEKTGVEIPETLLDYADNLTKYGVMPRYPNEIEVDEYMAKTAVAQASEILDWAKSVIYAA